MFIAIFIFSQETPQKFNEEAIKLWDIAKDDFSLEDNGILEIARLSLDESSSEDFFIDLLIFWIMKYD